MVAILYNIRIVHNIGSIFRTASAAGIKKLYLCGITPVPVDRFEKIRPRFSKVALGAEKYVLWEKHEKVEKVLDNLKSEGFSIIAVEQSKNSIQLNKFKIKNKNRKIALIFGNEVNGIPKSILGKSDAILEIPIFGKKESLNVSVAFGVVVFHLALILNKKKIK